MTARKRNSIFQGMNLSPRNVPNPSNRRMSMAIDKTFNRGSTMPHGFVSPANRKNERELNNRSALKQAIKLAQESRQKSRQNMEDELDNITVGPKVMNSETDTRYNFSSPRRVTKKMTAQKYTETMKKNVIFYEAEEDENYEEEQKNAYNLFIRQEYDFNTGNYSDFTRSAMKYLNINLEEPEKCTFAELQKTAKISIEHLKP
jgi:hypothetical protein